jgi:hypothetical protein
MTVIKITASIAKKDIQRLLSQGMPMMGITLVHPCEMYLLSKLALGFWFHSTQFKILC